MATITALFLALAAPVSQSAPMAHDTATCPATPVTAPAELVGWGRAVPVRGGFTAADATPLTIGIGVVATLRPTPSVRYPLRPEKPGGSVSHGGIFAFTVTTAGRYRVALGSAAWIDVVSGGAAATSVAHGHGPDCTGIRKMVDFDLRPGSYLLQVAGNGQPRVPLMVARLPE